MCPTEAHSAGLNSLQKYGQVEVVPAEFGEIRYSFAFHSSLGSQRSWQKCGPVPNSKLDPAHLAAWSRSPQMSTGDFGLIASVFSREHRQACLLPQISTGLKLQLSLKSSNSSSTGQEEVWTTAQNSKNGFVCSVSAILGSSILTETQKYKSKEES